MCNHYLSVDEILERNQCFEDVPIIDPLLKVAPTSEAVGCAFGAPVIMPFIRHQNEIEGEWCETCGYHHPLGQHEIPLAEAVEECKRISDNLPSEDAKARIWQKISKRLNS